MTPDDLTAPLGQGKPAAGRKAGAIRWQPVVATLLAVPVVAFAGVTLWSNDPFGGEPVATSATIASADVAATPETTAAALTQTGIAVTTQAAPERPANVRTVTIIDGSTGARREVTIPGPGSSTLDVAPDAPQGPPKDHRLLEQSRHGLLPRMAKDGTRPADAYARPILTATDNARAPRIAIVIGGNLGIGAEVTIDALRKLPGPVTFAFAPYGANLERNVARARETGHEVMLQIPMEPLDYPNTDPGPNTLIASMEAGQTLDRLHWLMSRFQGYVGLVNYMGGRFTASEPSIAPVLREAATRGLIYLDDSTSAKSLAGEIAGNNNVPFAKADVVIDQAPTAAEIDKALGRLESIARARGTAIGFAGALPVSIERISRWVKAAESRGIQLIPITVATASAKSS